MIEEIGIDLSKKPLKYADNVGRCLDFYGDTTYDLAYNLGINVDRLNEINKSGKVYIIPNIRKF